MTKTDKQKNDRIYELILDAINTDTVKRLVELSAFRDHDWIAMVYDWLHEFDNGALTLEEGGYIKLERIIVALYESNILDRQVAADVSKIALDSMAILRRWGVQTQSSLYRTTHRGGIGRAGTVEAAILLLMRRELIELALPPNSGRTAADDQEAIAYINRLKELEPYVDDDHTKDFYVHR